MTPPIRRFSRWWTAPALMAVLVLGLTPVACSGGSSKKKKKKADIAVAAFSHQVVGSTVTYTVTIWNQGNRDAAMFDLEIYYDSALPPGSLDVGDDSQTILSLPAGLSLNIQFVRPATSPGTYTSWAQLDRLDVVPEKSETNNVAGPEVVMIATSGGDIALTSLTFLAPGAGAVIYTVEVSNPSGTNINTPFDVHLYYDLPGAPTGSDLFDESSTVNFLGAGATTMVTFFRLGAASGIYDSWVWADGKDAVAETDEMNNVAGPVVVTIP